MKRISVVWLVLVQFILGFEWLHASWGKWTEVGFMANITKTLTGFATQTTFPVYGDFLRSVAIPNAELFGNFIRTGEILVGVAFVLGGILLLAKKYLSTTTLWLVATAMLGGALMNLNFYLAAGASSPSTWGLNVIMGLIQLVLAIYYFSNRKYLANQN